MSIFSPLHQMPFTARHYRELYYLSDEFSRTWDLVTTMMTTGAALCIVAPESHILHNALLVVVYKERHWSHIDDSLHNTLGLALTTKGELVEVPTDNPLVSLELRIAPFEFKSYTHQYQDFLAYAYTIPRDPDHTYRTKSFTIPLGGRKVRTHLYFGSVYTRYSGVQHSLPFYVEEGYTHLDESRVHYYGISDTPTTADELKSYVDQDESIIEHKLSVLESEYVEKKSELDRQLVKLQKSRKSLLCVDRRIDVLEQRYPALATKLRKRSRRATHQDLNALGVPRRQDQIERWLLSEQ